jgi:hypothetical protein
MRIRHPRTEGAAMNREAFEAEARKHGFILDRLDKSGVYVQLITEQAWSIWQAATAAAINKICADVQAAGFANGGIETPADVAPEILFQLKEKIEAATAAALAAPATAPEKTVKEIMEFARHYAADTFSSATLEDKIRRSLAAPATAPAQPERKPMTKGQREQVARRAEAAMNGNVNLSWRDALISETEAFHDIKETP